MHQFLVVISTAVSAFIFRSCKTWTSTPSSCSRI